MARPWTTSVTGVGVSPVYPVDIHSSGTIAMAAVATGTIVYKAQYTLDDVFAATFDPSTATWFDHADVAGAAAGSTDGNFAYLPRGIRMNVTSGTGTVTLIVVPSSLSGK